MTGLGGAIASGMLTGCLHALSLGPAWGWAVAWVALVPLLYTAARAPARYTLCATLVYTATLLAIDVAPWFLPTLERYFRFDLAWALGAIAMAITAVAYATLLGLALALRRRAATALGVVWCAALWSAWEGLRTGLVPPYFPLSILGTSQVGTLPVLQLASITGIAGVTALVVAANAAIAGLWSTDAASPRRRLAKLAMVVAFTGGVAAWGAARVTRAPSPPDDGTRVVLVDGAAADAAESTLERYIAATPSRADPLPTLVVWPESAISVDLERDSGTWRRLRTFVDDLGATLVTGGTGSAIASGGSIVHFNSVHVLRPLHGMVSYHKRRLVPFAESWPAAFGPPPAALEPVAAGRDLLLFGDGPVRFGPLICFEITDAPSVCSLARRGARLVINVNNDVWFGNWEPPHLVWARVRAVESGLPIVRATNGGESAIIDAFGRVTASARSAGGPVVLAGTIPAPIDTLYVRTGDVFLPTCVLVLLAGLVPRRHRLTDRPRMPSRSCPL